jgi:hypothetical protein
MMTSSNAVGPVPLLQALPFQTIAVVLLTTKETLLEVAALLVTHPPVIESSANTVLDEPTGKVPEPATAK